MLAKSKLNRIEVLISKAFINSNITYDKFVSANEVLKEYDSMVEEIKTLKILGYIQNYVILLFKA